MPIMPVLSPIPIKTKGVSYRIALWRWITSIRKWEVTQEWNYELPDGVTAVIPQGFGFDGASIPKIFWGILSPTGLLLIPGLIHDYAYRYDKLMIRNSEGGLDEYQKKSGKKTWDRLFRDVAIEVNGFHIINHIAFRIIIG